MSEMFGCDICCGMVADEDRYSINVAIIGEPIILTGHQVCLQNVDGIIVIPFRGHMIAWEKKFLEFMEEQQFEAEIKRQIQELFSIDPDIPKA